MFKISKNLAGILVVLFFIAVFEIGGSQTVSAATFDESSYYGIINYNSGKALDVLDFSTDNGATLGQWNYWGGSCQSWQIVDTGNGYYAIINKNSGLALDVLDFSTENGATVSQWDYWGGDCQLWQITDQGDGYYSIINKNSGLALDVLDFSTENGATVSQWEYWGGSCQLWQIVSPDLIVAQDNTGNYDSVQDAIDAAPSSSSDEYVIYIKDGTYKEVLNIPSTKTNLTLIGHSNSGTILTYDNYAGKTNSSGGTYGTTGSSSTFIYANDFKAENLTFENSFDEASVSSTSEQAVALYANADRMIFKNCRIIGNQDTLYTRDGTQYYYKCYIEGDVDFIFGEAQAVFDDCDIYSLDRGSSSNNGYVTAASTQISDDYGYLFIDCRLNSDAADGTVYLGRPWHPGGDVNAIASVLYKNCYLGGHINDVGWTDMSGFLASDSRFYEYNNYGDGAVINSSRPQLTDSEASYYTIENVLNGWEPDID